MYLEKIFLKNYRNIKKNIIKLNPGINILIGDNGQGKTNFLESIYILGTGSSHRTNRDKELINWKKESTLIQVNLVKKDYSIKISLIIDNTSKKPKINDNPLEKFTELIGNLNVVLFSPEDLKLVKGSPANRRKFLNIEVSQVSSYYHKLLNKYNHVLKQRNNLLKNIRSNTSSNEMLEVWDEQLSELGAKIIKKRLEVIEKLKILARLNQRKITEGTENLSIEYKNSIKDNIEEENDIKVIFKQNLVNNRNKEIERGYTITGPHRDDLIFKINEKDVRKFGSQGQQRTVALSLKLAELEFMKSEIGEYPILLLDDVFSELDKKRKNTLINVIKNNIQTIITSTDFEEFESFSNSIKYFKVNNGNLKKIDKKIGG
ncbi:MAG: DNA replication/repair protein RecF [Halanaerobiaceae bacterium]